MRGDDPAGVAAADDGVGLVSREGGAELRGEVDAVRYGEVRTGTLPRDCRRLLGEDPPLAGRGEPAIE